MQAEVSPEYLAAVAGVVLSLAFAYIPGLRRRYEPLAGVWKRVIMACLLLVVAVATYGLGCAGIVGGVSCTEAGVLTLVQAFIAALVANQSTYSLAVTEDRPKA